MSSTSTCSSPSPPASSSSLRGLTLEDGPEIRVPKEEEEEMDVDQVPSTSTATTNIVPNFDINMLQNNLAFQALLSASTNLGETANLTISKLFGSAKLTGLKREGSPTEGEAQKKTRMKVFANGYFMTFDKVSSCQKKHFWRCEYKNTCKARMHTDILSEKILTFIHDHNHSEPTDDEIRLYGLDPATVEKNRVYIVGNTADPNQRRKIRKQVADAEAAQKRIEAQKQEDRQHQETVAAISAARQAIAQAGVSQSPATSLLQSLPTDGSMTSHAMLLAQLPFIKKELPPPPYLSPSLPLQTATPTVSADAPLVVPEEVTTSRASVKRRRDADADEDWKRDPLFEPTFEIARKLRKLWKGEPSRYPRTSAAPTRHLDFFISKNDGSDEHLYMPMKIEQRDETHLKEALQEFCGEQCIGMLLFGISPKISVMFNQPMLNDWENNQFFLLDTSNPSRWRLMYVDDQTV